MPAERYLDLYARGLPYVDGGLFCVRKDVHERCPLNEAVAWDEAEELNLEGRLIELPVTYGGDGGPHAFECNI